MLSAVGIPVALRGAMEKQLDRARIGHRIALRRMELGLSQEALARLMGIKQSSVSIAESEGVVSLQGIARWAEALGCGAEWLAYGPDTQPAIIEAVPLDVIRQDIAQLEFKIEALGWKLAGAAREIRTLRAKAEQPARAATVPMHQLRPPVRAQRRG